MNQLLDAITFKGVKGSRTQITIVIFGVVNLLSQLGYLHISAEQLAQINQFLTWAGTFFFAEKVSK